MRYSVPETAVLSAAAARTGLSLSAYLGDAGLAVAEHRASSGTDMQRELLTALSQNSGLLRDVISGLDRITDQLNSSGIETEDLEALASYIACVAGHADEAMIPLRRRLS